MSWRPDALSKQVLLKRKTQIRQVEENLKRLLLPSADSSSKYEKKLEKKLSQHFSKPASNTQKGLLIAHKDMSLINYETSRWGSSSFVNAKKRHHSLISTSKDVHLVDELDADMDPAGGAEDDAILVE